MNFKANDLRNFQRLAQQLSNILKMRQDGLSTFITLPAVRSVATELKGVVHATCFIPGAFYELWAESFECLKLPFIDFEVGYEGTVSIRLEHASVSVVFSGLTCPAPFCQSLGASMAQDAWNAVRGWLRGLT